MRLIQPLALLLLTLLPLLVLALTVRRRRPSVRRIVPLVLRILAIAALAFVVSGAQRSDSQAGIDVIFAVDVSDSVGPEGSAEAELFVERALARAGEHDRAAIVLTGEEPVVERSLQLGLTRLTRESVLGTGATVLSEAILRSLGLFEGNRPRRIVLLSDGQETSGDAVEAARLARQAGVEVHTVPLSARASDGEVFVRSLDAPAQVRRNETHEFSVVVAAMESTDATVTVFRDGAYYGEDRVRLGPGDNVISFQGSFEESGIHRYRVTVSAAGDPTALNNESEALIRVIGEPTVLYVARSPAEPVLGALASQGVAVEVRTTETMPSDVAQLSPYDAVIFDNVPAYDLSVPRMEAIERYVRDTGGGFLMIGGDESYGAGGYYRTPIERTLPVDMDVTSTLKIPSLAMVFVIDKSGSMGAMEVSGLTKLDLVKEAVISAIEIMNPFYTTGLVAFDADFEWTVPMRRAGDRQSIVRDLSRLSSGGGTVLDGALREAFRTLRDTDAAVKHIIVLSDGLTSDAEFQDIVEQMRAESITVSTVSVGSSSDRELMQNLAEWGGGRSYHAADSRSVPRIFASETTIVSRNLIVEETFVPEVVAASPILDGIAPTDIPPLEGFVLTYQKAGAQMVLAGTGANPILSSWQYGLGRSVAFTSDLKAKWGVNWLGWPGYQQILAQTIRWVQRPAGTSDFTVRFHREADSIRMVVDAVSPEGSFRNLLDLSARIQPPDASPFEVHLDQTSPGRYEAEVPGNREGTYVVTIYGDAGSRPEPYGYVVPYGREYIQFETDYEQLARIARIGGGQVLSSQDADGIFTTALAGDTFSDDLWRLFLVVAVALLIVELLVKKLLLPIGTVAGPRSGSSRTADVRAEPSDDNAGPDSGVPSYAELRRQVAEAYREETQDQGRGRGIYIARKLRP